MDEKRTITESVKNFTIRQVCNLLAGEFVCGEDRSDRPVTTACGCDLMSDVLAFTKPGSILLTGLTNTQVIRTADILDLKAVIFVRSKRPDQQTIEMAKKLGITIILSPYPLYESCGLLYSAGLPGCQTNFSTKSTGIPE